mgnify:CR=1 FL=1
MPANNGNLIQKWDCIVLLNWLKPWSLKHGVALLQNNTGHLRMTLEKSAKNLNSVSLDLLWLITELIDKNTQDNVLNFWLAGHQLHKDLKGLFTIVLKTIFAKFYQYVCDKVSVNFFDAVVIICVDKIKVGNLCVQVFALNLWIILKRQ